MAPHLPEIARLSYRPAEAARATGLSPEFIKLLIKRGDLPVTRVGRAVCIQRRDIEGMMWARQQGWEPGAGRD